jgi:hypothetical protein
MSKAAKRQKAKRLKYFKRLSKNDLQKFDREWEKRISSWMIEIEKNAGRLRDNKARVIPAVFCIVDDALIILEECGKDIVNKYAKKTFDLLTTQCRISFSKKALPKFYRLNKRLHEL